MPTFWVKSGTGGDDSGSSWANAAESVAGLIAAQAIAGGDIIYVHNTHNHNAGAAITWAIPESGDGLVQVLCVDGGDPTGASLTDGVIGSLTTGARETTGGNYAVALIAKGGGASRLFIHGIAFEAGAGASSSSADISLNVDASGGFIHLSACSLYTNSTNVGALITIGNSATAGGTSGILENCTFKFGTATAGQGVYAGGGHWILRNCSVDAAGSTPNSLFFSGTNLRGTVECRACNLTNCTYVVNQAVSSSQKFIFSNCAISTPVGGTRPNGYYPYIEFQACAAADATNGADLLSYYCETNSGIVEDSQTIYLTTGGAQGTQDDGTATSYSLRMQPSAIASKTEPLYTPWIYKKVASTGDKTITIKACDEGTDADELHTSELWLEVEYMGEPGATGTQRLADSPMSVFEVDDNCPIISGTIYRDVIAAGADRTDTDDAWTGITETNSYTLTASLNIAEQGYIRCRVGLAFDRDVYVDPKIGVA